MKKIGSLPLSIRPDYATEIFQITKEIDFKKSLNVIGQIMIVLPNIDENFIDAVLCDFIVNRFSIMTKDDSYFNDRTVKLFLKIFVKYLLICKTKESQNMRFKKVGLLYLARLQSYWESTKNNRKLFTYLEVVISSLKYYRAFLNEEYVSCLPVMENIAEWMKTFLPMEQYFMYYVPLHLNMLFYKAIRQAAKQKHDVFADKQKRCSEGCKMVGENFGKYIGHEIRVLTKKYFDSIVMLYNEGLVDYICDFYRGRYLIAPHIIKGIIEVAVDVEYVTAARIYNDNLYIFNVETRKEIMEKMGQKSNIVNEFYFYYLVSSPVY